MKQIVAIKEKILKGLGTIEQFRYKIAVFSFRGEHGEILV